MFSNVSFQEVFARGVRRIMGGENNPIGIQPLDTPTKGGVSRFTSKYLIPHTPLTIKSLLLSVTHLPKAHNFTPNFELREVYPVKKFNKLFFNVDSPLIKYENNIMAINKHTLDVCSIFQ